MTTLTGTGALSRLALRRDRLWLAPWLFGIVILAVSTATSLAELYPTVASRMGLAATAETNPALLTLVGRGYELTTVGGLTAWRVGGFAAVIAALMNIFLVVRHTRADEDSGRTELIGSSVVGRWAALSAALVVAGLADLMLILLLTAGLFAVGGLPITGSLALATAIGLTGAVFAGITAITAQLATTARGANGAAGTLLGVAFLIRAAGDLADNGLGWLSPLGWVARLRAFAGERWWVLVLFGAVLLVTSAWSFFLAQRREYGAGLLPPKGGRTAAARSLSGPLGLAWRLQRASILAWCLGFAVVGASLGAVARDVGDLLRDSPGLVELVRQLGGADVLADAYLTTTYGLMGLLAAGFVVSSVLRLRQEEAGGCADAMLATPMHRVRWALGHTLVAAVGASLMLATIGTISGLIHGAQIGDVGGALGRLTIAALAQAPAVWVIAAVTVLLVGWVPRAAAAAWGVVLACLAVGQFGGILRLPTGLIEASPFGHVPGVGEMSLVPVAVLTAIAVALAALGLRGLRRRDIG